MCRQAAIVVAALVLATTPLHAQVTLFTVTTSSADVHRGPSTGSPVIGQAPRGRTFEVMRNLGSWVRVEWPDTPDGVAYLHVSWGTMSRATDSPEGVSDLRMASTQRDTTMRGTVQGGRTPAAQPPAAALPPDAQTTLFTITTASADVHRGPSTGSAVIGQAPRGRTFEVMRNLGSWVRVEWPDERDGVAYLHVTWGTMSGGDPDGIDAAAADDSTLPDTDTAQGSQTPVVTVPSHVIGLGGRTGSPALGFAITGRAWTHGRYGIQIEAGKSTHASAAAPGRLSTLQVSPSLIYSLPNLVTNYFWLRPYVGGGASVYRSTLGPTPGAPAAVNQSLGYQAFGGAELTWAGLLQFALSADLRQQWAPTTFSGFESGGFGVSLSAHWYIK